MSHSGLLGTEQKSVKAARALTHQTLTVPILPPKGHTPSAAALTSALALVSAIYRAY